MDKKTTRIYLIGLVAIIVFVAFWSQLQRYPQRPRAAGTQPAAIFMNPLSAALGPDGSQEVTLSIQTFNTAHRISGFELYLKTEGQMQIVSSAAPYNSETNDTSIFTELTKQITANQAVLSYVVLGDDSTLPAIIKLKVTVKGMNTAGAGKLFVDTTQTQIVGNISDNTYFLRNVDEFKATFGNVPTSTPAPTTVQSPTPTGSGGCQRPASPTGLTPNGTVTNGRQNLSWDRMPGAGSYNVSVQDMGQGYGGSVTGKTDTYFTDVIPLQYDFIPGHMYRWWVIATSPCGAGNSAPNEAYVFVQPGSPGASVTPTPGGNSSTPTPTKNPNATPVPTATPGMIKINFSVRFQGIVTKPQVQAQTIKARITLIKNSDREHPLIKMSSFTYDKHGVWITTEQFQMYPTDGVTFFIEPEKHLQRRICDGRPTDITPFSYRCFNGDGQIVLGYGENNFDFTRLLLFAGDIPFKGENDGVIDAYDISYIRTHLGQVAPIADLNYDGETDTQDYQIAISAMQIQRHDEY